MLMRFDPFRELEALADQLRPDGRRDRFMPMDAYRVGEEFHVDFDIPGVDPASIELTVEKDVLMVKAERRWEAPEGVQTVVCERPEGTFTRELFLADTLDADHITAAYENGVLRLTIPVAEEAKPRKIQVTSSPKAEAIETTTAA